MSFGNTLSYVAALLVLGVVPSYADLAYSNTTGGTVRLHGQLNPAILSFDDGVNRYTKYVDNEIFNSRLGLTVTQPLGSSVLTFDFLTGIGLAPSSTHSQLFDPKFFDWDRTFVRELQVSLETKAAGTFTFGQGSMATDEVAEVDLSQTDIGMYNGMEFIVGGYQFRTSAGALSGVAYEDTFTGLDSGRRFRAMYNSPDLNNFTISASYGQEILSATNNDKYADLAMGYENTFGDIEFKGAVGFSSRMLAAGGSVNDTFGSASALLPSGFNATVAAGSRKGDGKYRMLKLGYIADWLSVGKTAFAVDHHEGRDFINAGSTSESYGIGVVQHFDERKMKTYLVLRDYKYTDAAASYLPASSVLFGTLWEF